MSAPVIPAAGAISGTEVGITDGKRTIAYESLMQEFIKLDALINGQNSIRSSCICFPFNNTIDHIIVLLYLLDRKISFFIASANLLNREVPRFCDRILNMEDDTEGLGWNEIIDLVKNPGGLTGASPMPGEGMVVFASSGSTGSPKFICYEQEKLLANARNCAVHFRITPKTKVLVPVPASHMYGLGVGLLPAVIAGASVYVIEKNNVIKLIESILQFQPDISLINPSVARMVLTLNKKITTSGLFISAGEPLPADLRKAFSEQYGHLVNLYGCSELGAIATSSLSPRVQKDQEIELTPLPGVNVLIDEEGEILCRYDAVFSGYLDDRGIRLGIELGGEQWHKTGDLGKMLGPDSFEVSGRRDHCINRSGFLLSLYELETTLVKLFPGIDQVVCFELAEGKLLAVCKMKQGYIPDHIAVRSTCLQKMPRHSVPDKFYFVDNIPQLFNGKPDRMSIKTAYKN